MVVRCHVIALSIPVRGDEVGLKPRFSNELEFMFAFLELEHFRGFLLNAEAS